MGDNSRWEYMLPSNDKPNLVMPNLDGTDDDEKAVKIFDLIVFYNKNNLIFKRMPKKSKNI